MEEEREDEPGDDEGELFEEPEEAFAADIDGELDQLGRSCSRRSGKSKKRSSMRSRMKIRGNVGRGAGGGARRGVDIESC